jgi:glucose/arabinose dehydrogenase
MLITPLVLFTTIFTTPQYRFEPVHTELEFDEPIQVVFDGITDKFFYVVEKDGVVRRVSTEPEEEKKPIFLDIQNKCAVNHSEEGLLSLAFHPEYKTNKIFYVWYTATNPRRCVLSRFTSNEDGLTTDQSTEEVLLEVSQPWGNHNGGTVLFGKDGFLYVGIGDGGASNDPQKNGQNKKTLLASIIRIDPNNKGGEKLYSIPQDNPFVKEEGARGELWAIGLRNPWRMSFDRETGELWVGDVGQNKWEEIDIVKKGKNYGWNAQEGKHAFMKNKTDNPTSEPVFEYGRRSGGSITGGYVYRGSKIQPLLGKYIYADYLSRRTWALTSPSGELKEYEAQKIAQATPLAISSFGETPSGEIIACGFETPYSTTGKIYQLVHSLDSSPTD